MFIVETFQVHTDRIPSRRWNADLAQLFEFARNLTCSLNAEIQAGRLPQRSCVKSSLARIRSSGPAAITELQSLRHNNRPCLVTKRISLDPQNPRYCVLNYREAFLVGQQ